MRPLVSICVPTANRAALLRESLGHIRAQDYAPLEIILSDNASTDETESLCRQASGADDRIRYFRHSGNIGLYPNHNFCLDQARGDFMIFFHDDDWHHPSLIRRCVDFLERNLQVGLVCADWELMDDAGKTFARRRHGGKAVTPGAVYTESTIRAGRSSLNCPGTLIRREALGALRFDAEGPIGFGDFVLWFRIAENWDVGHIPEILWRYRIHSGSLSRRTILGMTGDYRLALTRYFDDRLMRRPSDAPRLRRFDRQMRRFLFWSLVYEICRECRGASEAPRTLFDRMTYRLTPDEAQQARKVLRECAIGYRETFARCVMEALLHTHLTWPLGCMARFIPVSWARAVLRLR